MFFFFFFRGQGLSQRRNKVEQKSERGIEINGVERGLKTCPTEHEVLRYVPMVFMFHLVCELEQKSIFSRQRKPDQCLSATQSCS